MNKPKISNIDSIPESFLEMHRVFMSRVRLGNPNMSDAQISHILDSNYGILSRFIETDNGGLQFPEDVIKLFIDDRKTDISEKVEVSAKKVARTKVVNSQLSIF